MVMVSLPAVMSAMISVHEEVHKRTEQQDQPGKGAHKVSFVLSPQEKAADYNEK